MKTNDTADKLKHLEDAISKVKSEKFDDIYRKHQIDDMMNKQGQQYDVRSQTWTRQDSKSKTKDIFSASSYEQARRDEMNKRQVYLKAALAMLRTHKRLDLRLDGVESMSQPWEDPLSLGNTIVKIVDKAQMIYGNYRNNFRFYVLMTLEDFEERYGPKDYENKIPRVQIPTVVTMRLATKIYWAWKENIYNKK